MNIVYRVKETSKWSLARWLVSIFAQPAIIMITWGAFINMSDLGWPAFGYWECFMLRLAFMIFRTVYPQSWDVEVK